MTRPEKSASDDSNPGVPVFKTWRGVYLFAFVTFVAVVVFLTVFSRTYA